MACKDHNNLPPGILWRRVYEVVGGGWEKSGPAWISSVFAYNLSVACNHCERPICVEVCPTCAINKREDGVVLIDPQRCIGCQYCSWACPYGALQYDAQAGKMTKCTFCIDQIEQGLPPACVAACPMRALDFGELAELVERHGALPELYPLPMSELTRPALVISPHPEAQRAQSEPAWLANRAEIKGPVEKAASLVPSIVTETAP